MLSNRLRDKWRTRERSLPISPLLRFTSEGLILGANTVSIAADRPHRVGMLKGQEAQAAAYGQAVAPSVLGNIACATKAWSGSCQCWLSTPDVSAKRLSANLICVPTGVRY